MKYTAIVLGIIGVILVVLGFAGLLGIIFNEWWIWTKPVIAMTSCLGAGTLLLLSLRAGVVAGES